jgi:hypothetical protein
MTFALTAPRPALPDLRRMWVDAPAFAGMAVVLALALLPLITAMALDLRLFDGESPWLKPVKFHIALSLYLITLAFLARFLAPATRAGRGYRLFESAVVFAVLAEVVWLSAAAMQNTASHFNTEVPVFAAVYGVMGAFAVLLTSASLVTGVAILRNAATGLAAALHLSIALGLILTFWATLVVAGYLSSQGSHVVGTSTDTLWLLGWSRDAGDLRVAHFLATHAMHAVPLAGLLAAGLPPRTGKRVVVAAAAAYALLVAGTFVQALNGQPFMPFLG